MKSSSLYKHNLLIEALLPPFSAQVSDHRAFSRAFLFGVRWAIASTMVLLISLLDANDSAATNTGTSLRQCIGNALPNPREQGPGSQGSEFDGLFEQLGWNRNDANPSSGAQAGGPSGGRPSSDSAVSGTRPASPIRSDDNFGDFVDSAFNRIFETPPAKALPDVPNLAQVGAAPSPVAPLTREHAAGSGPAVGSALQQSGSSSSQPVARQGVAQVSQTPRPIGQVGGPMASSLSPVGAASRTPATVGAAAQVVPVAPASASVPVPHSPDSARGVAIAQVSDQHQNPASAGNRTTASAGNRTTASVPGSAAPIPGPLALHSLDDPFNGMVAPVESPSHLQGESPIIDLDAPSSGVYSTSAPDAAPAPAPAGPPPQTMSAEIPIFRGENHAPMEQQNRLRGFYEKLYGKDFDQTPRRGAPNDPYTSGDGGLNTVQSRQRKGQAVTATPHKNVTHTTSPMSELVVEKGLAKDGVRQTQKGTSERFTMEVTHPARQPVISAEENPMFKKSTKGGLEGTRNWDHFVEDVYSRSDPQTGERVPLSESEKHNPAFETPNEVLNRLMAELPARVRNELDGGKGQNANRYHAGPNDVPRVIYLSSGMASYAFLVLDPKNPDPDNRAMVYKIRRRNLGHQSDPQQGIQIAAAAQWRDLDVHEQFSDFARQENAHRDGSLQNPHLLVEPILSRTDQIRKGLLIERYSGDYDAALSLAHKLTGIPQAGAPLHSNTISIRDLADVYDGYHRRLSGRPRDWDQSLEEYRSTLLHWGAVARADGSLDTSDLGLLLRSTEDLYRRAHAPMIRHQIEHGHTLYGNSVHHSEGVDGPAAQAVGADFGHGGNMNLTRAIGTDGQTNYRIRIFDQ